MEHETIQIHHADTGTEQYHVCSLKGKQIGEIFQLESGEYVYMPVRDGFGAYSEQTMREIADQLYEWNRPSSEQCSSQPYITQNRTETERFYNKDYGDDRLCKCGHTYYRHFDSYENMQDCGCKYCNCNDFEEADSAS